MWEFVVLLDQVVPGWYDAINSHANSNHCITPAQTLVDIPHQFGHLRLWQDRTGLELVQNDRASVPFAPRQAHVLEDEDVYDNEDINEADEDDNKEEFEV